MLLYLNVEPLPTHDATPLNTQLNALESAELIELAAVQPELEYLFRHTLIHEATYDSLLKQERRRLHLVVGEALERLYAGRLDEIAPLLARHFQEAGDDERALRYYIAAGQHATRRYANAEALAHYDSAIAVARRVNAMRPDLYRSRGLARETLGDFAGARMDHDAALQMARAAKDRRAEWQALLDLGKLWASRDYTRTRDYFERALALAREIGDPAAIARSLNRVGNWHLNVDQPLEAQRLHQEALAIFQRLENKRGIAQTLDLLALAVGNSGDQVAARVYYERAIALFREFDDRPGLVSSLSVLAEGGPGYEAATMLPASTFAETRHYLEEALALARGIGWRAGEAFALAVTGAHLGVRGDYGPALESLGAALRIATEIEHAQWTLAAHCILGAVIGDLLALPAARRHLEGALRLADEIGSMTWMRIATRAFVPVTVAQRDFEAAEAAIARALGPDASMRGAVRNAWLVRAELDLARGDAARALRIVEELIATAPGIESAGEQDLTFLAKLKGDALAALGQPDRAAAALDNARRGAEAFGLLPLLWRIHVACGRLSHAQARLDEAEREYSAAQAIVARLALNVPDENLRANFRRQATAYILGIRPSNIFHPSG